MYAKAWIRVVDTFSTYIGRPTRPTKPPLARVGCYSIVFHTRIMADGTRAPGQITAIKARTNGQAIVNFSFDPTGAGEPVTGRQRTSMAAVRQRGLMPGSSVTVHYLPKWRAGVSSRLSPR